MTALHSTHPDWNQVKEKILWGDTDELPWLHNYIKSHDINQCTNEHGNTLLHHAVKYAHKKAVLSLSTLLIDPNVKNATGQTALQLAKDASAEFLECVQHHHLCISFSQAQSQPNGLDALFATIYRGDETLGDTSGIKDDGNEANVGGWTALQCAAMYNRPHLIRELHRQFPKLDVDLGNYPALSLAVARGHLDCIIALCECFPSIKANDALQTACKYNRQACIPSLRKCFPRLTGNELVNNYCSSSALICAVESRNPECIPVLSEYFPDIDPNKTDSVNSNTALMCACGQGLSHLITLLATYFPSIDPNMRNISGRTALIMVIEKRDEKCMFALSEAFPNINPNQKDIWGDTALIFTARQYNPGPIISQLCTFFPNTDPNAQNNNQDTMLMLMLQLKSCSIASISQFIDTFPNVDAEIQNAQGDTALTLAIKTNSPQLVLFLLGRFPDINLEQHTINSTLALAIKQNYTDLLSKILMRIIQVD